MTTLKRFEQLLNKQIEKLGSSCTCKDACICTYSYSVKEGIGSYNDLFFSDSLFLESLVWDTSIVNGVEGYGINYTTFDVEYHKIQLVLLKTNEQRMEYILSNIKE